MKRLLKLLKTLVTGKAVNSTAVALPMSRSGIYGGHAFVYQLDSRSDRTSRTGQPAAE